MLIRYGCGITLTCTQPTALVCLCCRSMRIARTTKVPETTFTTPDVPVATYRDFFGNRCRRLVAPGALRSWPRNRPQEKLTEKSAKWRFRKRPETRPSHECAHFRRDLAREILAGARPRSVVVHQQRFEPLTQMMHWDVGQSGGRDSNRQPKRCMRTYRPLKLGEKLPKGPETPETQSGRECARFLPLIRAGDLGRRKTARFSGAARGLRTRSPTYCAANISDTALEATRIATHTAMKKKDYEWLTTRTSG